MKLIYRKYVPLLALASLFAVEAVSQAALPPFFSSSAREHDVTFSAYIRTDKTSLDQIKALSSAQQASFLSSDVKPLMKYLFGPATHNSLGSPQRSSQLSVDWNSAKLVNGKVELLYTYTGPWILRKDIAAAGSWTQAVPLNGDVVFTPNWKSCTDSAPEHQTTSFYWYFWDPARSGCDQVLERDYREVKFLVGAATLNQTQSFPEYEKLLKSNGIDKNLQMTFAFGYVEDATTPNPDSDQDYGMREYQDFVKQARTYISANAQNIVETPILQSEYPNATSPNTVIGHRFIGTRQGVKVSISVVAAGGIDQMYLFAKSFAHDHDGFFAWMGHSRVGSGFDAQNFGQIVANDPAYFSISSQYQVIYWGGCNSYSYYTLPFFKFKQSATDPTGTKGLDIIANGLPSLFSFNSGNALIALHHILNWDEKASYQTILTEIEDQAANSGTYVLSAVLGDEDNAL